MSRHSGRERNTYTDPATTETLPAHSPVSALPGKRALSALTLLSGSLFLLTCGVQGPPQPPRLERPERVRDLAVAQIGRTFELSFTPPMRATDGERLTKSPELQFFRTVTPRGEKPQGAPASLRPWAAILATDLTRYTPNKKIVFLSILSDQDFNQWQGATFNFTVRSLTRGRLHKPVESEPSNIVEVTLLDVSGPVESLEVGTTEKALELHWSAPSRTLSGRPVSNLVGYHVFKSLTGKPESFQLLGETNATGYRDLEFEFDHKYFYKVRAVFKENGQVAESEDPEIREVTPHDTFPPAAPTGLSAIYTAGAVELIWTANTEPDLAGYNVYRRDERGEPGRINSELRRTPIFRDSSVESGHKYFYHVTAVDLSENESRHSAEFSVETR